MDNAARTSVSHCGVTGVSIQDQAITESMGPVTDHTWEHLAPSDRIIIATRKRLVSAARALAQEGRTPLLQPLCRVVTLAILIWNIVPIFRTTSPLMTEVETNHQNARFSKYLIPDLEWTCSLLNVHLW